MNNDELKEILELCLENLDCHEPKWNAIFLINQITTLMLESSDKEIKS